MREIVYIETTNFRRFAPPWNLWETTAMTAQTNPILEEVWRIKDDIAREAEYEPRRLCENTRRWVAQNMPDGMKAFTFEEWRSFLTKERAGEVLAACEDSHPYGARKD